MGEAFSDAGMKVNLSPALTCSDDSRFDELPICKTMGELSERFAGHPLVHVGAFSIDAEYTTTEKSVRGAADYAREHGLRLHLHLSETESEHNECIARNGVHRRRSILRTAACFLCLYRLHTASGAHLRTLR